MGWSWCESDIFLRLGTNEGWEGVQRRFGIVGSIFVCLWDEIGEFVMLVVCLVTWASSLICNRCRGAAVTTGFVVESGVN